jgi:ABC-2 type transport system ATP-binding protein
MSSIHVEHISKSYGKDVQALKDVSLQVQPGELFGLIGPDGAGKTTLFRILTTLMLADEGSASVNGWDVVKGYEDIRKHVGYMPGKFSLYQDLSVAENLKFFASVFNTTIEENYHLIEDIYVQLEPFKNRRAGKLSGGMKQKLALCCALIHKPIVLFLDEPTTGVDPVSRREFWQMLKRLKAQEITILVSTPYMDEAEMCDRIALINKGEILSVDTPEGLKAAYGEELLALKSSEKYKLLTSLESYHGTIRAYAFGEYMHAVIEGELDELQAYLTEKGLDEVEIKQGEVGIEDCFIKYLTGK